MRQNLAFCNRCGARVSTELEKSRSAELTNKNADIVQNLSMAVGFVGLGGIIAIAILIFQIIRQSDISYPAVVLVMTLTVLVFSIVFLLTTQISRLSSASIFDRFPRGEQPESLSDIQNEQLPPHFQPARNSVTEYTTRNLDNVPREKY